MKEFIAAGVQIAVKPNDIKYNVEKCCSFMKSAAKDFDAELVVFPESITTGFTPNMEVEDFYKLIGDIEGYEVREVSKCAKDLGCHVVLPMYERGPSGVIYNSSVLIDDTGNVLDVYRKTHPFPTERLGDGGWTTPGNRPVVVDTKLGKIGMIICYDGDFPELSRVLTLMGAEVITRPSALLRSYEIWELTNKARAYDNHVYMISVNAIGPDAKENYYFGNSMIIDPIASKLAQARGTEEIMAARLNPEPLKYISLGTKTPMIFDHVEDRNIEAYKNILMAGKSSFEPSKRIPYK